MMQPPLLCATKQVKEDHLLYMINAFRYGFLGITDIDLATAFIIILLFITGLFMFALHLLNKGVGIKP